MRLRRIWLLPLLACLVIDFANPSLPGVFVFDGDQLFLNSGVTLTKAALARIAPPHLARSARRIEPDHADSSVGSDQNLTLRRFTRRAERRYLGRAGDVSSLSPSPDDH